MENDLIVVEQLPVIKDQLLAVKQSIQERVGVALSLVCTEETYKDVKKVRSELNKEYTELEKRRKEVKAQILKPYEEFERVYKECAGDLYADADKKLAAKIHEVEDGLKSQKGAELKKYFTEYRASVGLPDDFVTIEDAAIRIGLSDSLAGLKKKVAEFLDRIASDLQAIETHEDRDEILAEYRRGFNLAQAMSTVSNRHREIEAQKKAREEAEARAKAQREAEEKVQAVIAAQEVTEQPIAAPVAVPVPESVPVPEVAPAVEKTYSTAFRVTGTLEMLKELKRFLVEGGYQYESI